jgi:cytochrome c peroxidase
MQQQAVFTEKEEKGYTIFKKHCASCHTEPLFTNDQFYNNGLKVDTLILDYGRYRVTLQSTDSLKFKVPTLRNIEYTFPYMHDGRFKRLSQVINHYTSGIVDTPTLAAELKFPIQLNSNEKVELINFLLTLSDKSFLFDQKYGYPKEIFLVPPKD